MLNGFIQTDDGIVIEHPDEWCDTTFVDSDNAS